MSPSWIPHQSSSSSQSIPLGHPPREIAFHLLIVRYTHFQNTSDERPVLSLQYGIDGEFWGNGWRNNSTILLCQCSQTQISKAQGLPWVKNPWEQRGESDKIFATKVLLRKEELPGHCKVRWNRWNTCIQKFPAHSRSEQDLSLNQWRNFTLSVGN